MASGDIVTTYSLNNGPFRAGLKQSEQEAARSLAQMQAGVRRAGKEFQQLSAAVDSVSGALRNIGAEVPVSLGAASATAKGLMKVFTAMSSGFGIGLLVNLATPTINSLLEMQEKADRLAERMQVLHGEFGITERQVDSIKSAFDEAGLAVDKMAAQQIAKLAAQAGLTSVDVARLTDQIKTLATLEGIDATAAAEKVIGQYRDTADDTIKRLQELRKALVDAGKTPEQIARDDELIKQGEIIADQLQKRFVKERELAEARKGGKSQREYEKLNADLAEINAKIETAHQHIEKINAEYADTSGVRQTLEQGKATEAELRKRAQLEEQLKREAAARSKARAAAHLETNVSVMVAARDEEGAAVARLVQALGQLEQRRREGTISAADAARQATALAEQHRDAVDAIARQMVARQMDARLQVQAAEAQLTGNLIAQARLRGEATAEQFRRQQADHTRDAARTQRRIQELEEETAEKRTAEQQEELERLQQFHADQVALAEAAGQQVVIAERGTAQEIQRIHRDRQRSAMDFDLQTEAILAGVGEDRLARIRLQTAQELEMVRRLEEDKTITAQQAASRRAAILEDEQAQISRATQQQTAEAMQAGASIGQGILDGIKSVQQGDDWKSIFKSILQTIGSIVSLIPGGGQLAGLGLNLFAGFFADGGHIRGPGGPRSDRVIAAVSAGEYVAQAAAVDKFGVRFFDSLNAGVLDLGALPRFASGGMVGGSRPSGPAVSGGGRGGGNVTINIAAFDPTSAREAVRDVWEDAQYARGAARASAKATHGLRRQVAAPRPGR